MAVALVTGMLAEIAVVPVNKLVVVIAPAGAAVKFPVAVSAVVPLTGAVLVKSVVGGAKVGVGNMAAPVPLVPLVLVTGVVSALCDGRSVVVVVTPPDVMVVVVCVVTVVVVITVVPGATAVVEFAEGRGPLLATVQALTKTLAIRQIPISLLGRRLKLPTNRASPAGELCGPKLCRPKKGGDFCMVFLCMFVGLPGRYVV